ncbi:MAG TPA: hypothetical protein P5137_02145 [Candidatus Brocadiia bacterium]|nr:hypothetical protein [Candidatus Brocadiia bacterium]
MRRLCLAAAAIAWVAAGCLGGPPAQEHSVYGRAVIRSPRAMYAFAAARDSSLRCDEMLASAVAQNAERRQRIREQQDLYVEAGVMRNYRIGSRDKREADARNMDGDADGMEAQIRNRKKVVETVYDCASWYSRHRDTEIRRVHDYLRWPVPSDGRVD